MKLHYTYDYETGTNAVTFIGIGNAKIWRHGIKRYEKRHYANKYLQSIMEETVKLPDEPDEIVKKEPGESDAVFEERVLGDAEHIGLFERIFPTNPDNALETPTTFYKSHCVFPVTDIWYKTEKEAKRDADGFETIYLGPVEVYDPDEIKRIEAEVASYPG